MNMGIYHLELKNSTLQLKNGNKTLKTAPAKEVIENYYEEIYEKTGDCMITDFRYIQPCRHEYLNDNGHVVEVSYFDRRKHTYDKVKIGVFDEERDDYSIWYNLTKNLKKKTGLKYIFYCDAVIKMYRKSIQQKPESKEIVKWF